MIKIPERYFRDCFVKYGAKMQRKITVEELNELSLACGKLVHEILKYERYVGTPHKGPFNTDNLIEEIADVYIMLNQFVYTHTGFESDVNKVILEKIDRDTPQGTGET